MLPYIFLKLFPNLKKQLKLAHIKEDPRAFIKKMMTLSSYLSMSFIVFFFFVFSKAGASLYFLLAIFPVVYFLCFMFMMQYPAVLISKRKKEIDREVLFAGRYLLVKIESGTPLFNALTDASRGFGVMQKYFKEIVDEIYAGVPIEQALENAREHSASKRFKKILAELIMSLKTGVDVGTSLRSIMKNISDEQLLEIKEYNKKLNAYITMYMIMAVVLPSLGMTMLVVIGAFLSLELSMTFIVIAICAFVFIDMLFLSLFRSIRPTVDL